MIGWKENVGENERKTKTNMNEKVYLLYLLTYYSPFPFFFYWLESFTNHYLPPSNFL